MKFIKTICIMLLAVNFTACKPSVDKSENSSVVSSAKLKTVSLDIKGMTCEIGCAKTIESKISKMSGVVNSKVSFENKKGVFAYDNNKTSKEEIINKINSLVDGKMYSAKLSEKKCNIGCEKPCCKIEKKECKPGCEKPCCTTKK